MCIRILRRTVAALAIASAITGPVLAAEPAALPANNAAIGDSSISGISSGAFMAIQFGTAWSSVIKGVGVIAGGPYWCAEADMNDAITWFSGPVLRATGACMTGRPPSDLQLGDFTAKADDKAKSGDIDPLQNILRQKIYLFHGTNDKVVARASTNVAADFYRHYLGDAAGNLFYQTTIAAGHSLVVRQDQQGDGLKDCSANESPFIDRCDNYDQAGILLQHIYGALNAPNRGRLGGKLLLFDQSIYTSPKEASELSLGDTGFVFVPDACARGERCRVHIALHGCAQDVGEAGVGRRFVEDTGYNAWADTNHLIVLYPQTRSTPVSNQYACWDWWSYVDHSDDYVTKSGPQIMAIKAMLDALTAHATPAAPLAAPPAPAPTGVAVIDTSDTSADLVWAPSGDATTYRIRCAEADGPFVTVGEVTGFSFGDSALKPRTSYHWHVSAVAKGSEGPPSTDVAATTRSTPPPCDTPGSCPINP